MYRHNQLKEELDKLRKENNSLKKQSEYLLWKLAQKDLQIGNLQFQLRVKDMSFQLSSLQKLIDDKKALEPFKAGVDIGTSKDKQVYTTSEIVNNESYKQRFCDLGFSEDMIDEIFNNKK